MFRRYQSSTVFTLLWNEKSLKDRTESLHHTRRFDSSTDDCYNILSIGCQLITSMTCSSTVIIHDKNKTVDNFPFYFRSNPEILVFGNFFRFCESAENPARHHFCGDVPNEWNSPHHKTLWADLSLAQHQSIQSRDSPSFSTSM